MGNKEKHVRRILFRFSQEEDWAVYAYNRVTFGDVIAALVLEVCKAILAKMGNVIDPMAAEQLLTSSFVDNGSSRRPRVLGESSWAYPTMPRKT